MTTPAPTPSGTAPSAPSAPANGLPPETMKALAAALDTEHAAVWAYGPIAAYVTDNAQRDRLNEIRSGHLARRDSTMGLILATGGQPTRPAAAYALPVAIKDLATARAAAYAVEAACAKAWRAVIGLTDIRDLRGLALAGLSDSAVWTTTIKLAAKDPKPTVPFPGT